MKKLSMFAGFSLVNIKIFKQSFSVKGLVLFTKGPPGAKKGYARGTDGALQDTSHWNLEVYYLLV